MKMISMIMGYPVGHAPDEVLVQCLAYLPRPSSTTALNYDFNYTALWLDIVDECKFRDLLPDWNDWSACGGLLQ